LGRGVRRLDSEDLARLAVFLDREVGGDQIGDRRAVFLRGGDEDGIGPRIGRAGLRGRKQVRHGHGYNDRRRHE
jgi:hypothetical protein